jgi:chemotaxis protein histidine kinase CheA
MNLEPAPRLSKTIFLIIDAVLLLTAFLIVYFNTKNPYAPLPFVSAILCVVLAAIIGLIPFLIDYAADSAEYVQAERERVSDQVQRLHAAGESLARAAAQIKAVEEAVHKTAHAAENLPYRMQEKLAEFNEALAQQEENDREALEAELVELRAANSTQLKAVADKIASAVADWTALESATRKHLAAAEAIHSKGQATAADHAAQFEARLKTALAQLDTRLAVLAQAGHNPAPVATPDDSGHRPPLSVEPSPVIESVTTTETAAAPEEPKPKKPRAPRKPKAEETVASIDGAASDGSPIHADTPQEPATPAISPEPAETASRDLSESARSELVESAASTDGATRLLATAYIGIGNKLYIRGDGPGLSWEKGEPMQFVSIGKWGWATTDATGPITCKLYKNDETAALTGEVVLEPGRHVEITALF